MFKPVTSDQNLRLSYKPLIKTHAFLDLYACALPV
jgi:hypothetical protein